MYRLLFVIIGVLSLFPFPLLGNTHYSFTQLSIAEGLSQANVSSILLDGNGDLWIGTRNGLNLYSKQVMKNFFHAAGNKYSLPDNHILHLAEDSLGNIWVATPQGLAIYDKVHKVFDTYTRGRVQASFCVEGGILFGGDNVLYFYDYHTRQLKQHIRIQPEGSQTIPIQYRVMKMIPFGPDKILVGTREQGIFVYHYRQGTFEPFTADFPRTLLFSICLASNQQVYASFYGRGVHCYDLYGKKIAAYMSGQSPLSNDYVMDVIEHQGKVWLATDGGGVNLIHLDTGAFSYLQHISGDRNSLPFNSITGLYKDPNGNLWLGSVRGGAIHVKDTYIRTYQDVVMNHDGGLTEKSVTSLYEEPDGRLWIGTDGGGVNLFRPETGRFVHYPNTYGDKVVSIAGLSEHELLISVYTKGFFVFDKRTGHCRPFVVKDEKTNQKVCFKGYIPLGHRVNKDKIYLIGYEPWVYHQAEHTFKPLVMPEEYRGLIQALQVAYTNDEFSLLKQGPYAFLVDQRTDSVSLLTETHADESITSMTYDASDRTVWIGTDRGLRLYDMDTKEYRTFPTALFSHVSFLTIDGQRRLWISAHNKLFSYSISDGRFTSWNNSDGYLPNEILSKYMTTRNRDFIYLCGTQGLVSIASSVSSETDEELTVYLSDLHYNGEPYSLRDQESRLEVPWNYRSVVLTFGVKSKDVFQKHLLRYTIRSASGEQVFDSYDPILNLSSLAPGEYTVFSSCYTKDGEATQPVSMLTLVVTPPWYRSGWFIGLMILLFVGVTLGVGRWMYQRKSRKMKGDVGEFLQTVLQSLNADEDKPEQAAGQPVLSEADKAFLDKMDRLIHDNLSNEELSIKFLTDHLAMSRASLYNKVKALTGLGVNDYINRIRIERSVRLLTTTNLSINEISYEVGFSYPRYFSTSFKQVKGMTPTQFKELNKKDNGQ